MILPKLNETWISTDDDTFYGKIVYVGKKQFVLELNSVYDNQLSIYDFEEINFRLKRAEWLEVKE